MAFEEVKPKESVEPIYPWVAFIIPEGRSIIGEGETRKEGIERDKKVFCPVYSADSLSHFQYLVHDKGYKFAGWDLKGQFPKLELALAKLGRNSGAIENGTDEVRSSKKSKG